MPFLSSDVYAEYDFNKYDLRELRDFANRFRRSIEKEAPMPAFFHGVEPPAREAAILFKELDELSHPVLYPNPWNKPAPAQKKRCKELQGIVCGILFGWGVQKFHDCRKDWRIWLYSGFPYVYLPGLRRPTRSESFAWEKMEGKKNAIQLSCRKQPGVRTSFHWQVSEDNGANWQVKKRTRQPECTIANLEPGKLYLFRMLTSNLRGKSPFSRECQVRL